MPSTNCNQKFKFRSILSIDVCILYVILYRFMRLLAYFSRHYGFSMYFLSHLFSSLKIRSQSFMHIGLIDASASQKFCHDVFTFIRTSEGLSFIPKSVTLLGSLFV